MTLKILYWSVAFGAVVVFCAAAIAQDAPKPAAKSAPQLNFDNKGPQTGEQVPDLRIHTLKGEEQRLSDAWKGGPTLLVTSSLTCPKSRSRWPELKALIDRYDEKLNVVIVYVIEAHPVGSVCPYKDVEDITPENERDGILRKQPKTLDDRLELAQEFKRLLRIKSAIYVDNMKDEAWKGLGGAPNLALLVDQEGKVVARSGWFEGEKSKAAIDKYLEAKKAEEDKDARGNVPEVDYRALIDNVEAQLEKAGFEYHEFYWSIREMEKPERFARMLKVAPQAANLFIEARQGHPYDATVLMDAVRYRNPTAVKLLLEHGADVKAQCEGCEAVLQLAAEAGDVAIFKMLLAKGADPAFPATGKSPLHEAAVNGHAEIAKLILSTGVRHDLYSAIALGELEMVRRGLRADPSRALRPDGADRMPMDYAAANGRIEIVKLLLEQGAPIVRDTRSRLPTPLHRAISRGDAAMVELLLSSGSSPNTSVGRGGEAPTSLPALHLAVEKKNLAIVKLLLSYKVDLNGRDSFAYTALHDAASTGQVEIVEALLQAGADVNVPQLGYEAPCGSGDEHIPSNTTPLHLAAGHGNIATLKALLAAGAKVNAATKKGTTPLMSVFTFSWKATEGAESRLPFAELLIAAGADVNAQNKYGQSVLDIARDTRHAEDPRTLQEHQAMITLLKKHGAQPGKAKAAENETEDPSGK